MLHLSKHIHNAFCASSNSKAKSLRYGLLLPMSLMTVLDFISCIREPELHLYEGGSIDITLPSIEVGLETYWNYELIYGVKYDWHAHWFYEWEGGEIGYSSPESYDLRRYYTSRTPYGPHTMHEDKYIPDSFYQDKFAWGFWDLLVWNHLNPNNYPEGIAVRLNSNEDSVIAYTGQTMTTARYQAPRYTHAFNQPEDVFAVYETGIDINEDLDGFEYNAERNVWIKRLDMTLYPLTYIYLTQIILLNNNGRVTGVDGDSNLSGMARTTNLISGRAGDDVITVNYTSDMKNNLPVKVMKDGKLVSCNADIIGGRLTTFGICGLAANKVTSPADINDPNRHYMDVKMSFNNATDSTLVIEMTDSVRRYFKGGVLTKVIDMDTVPSPTRKGGSGFDPVVKDYEDGGTHEFEM